MKDVNIGMDKLAIVMTSTGPLPSYKRALARSMELGSGLLLLCPSPPFLVCLLLVLVFAWALVLFLIVLLFFVVCGFLLLLLLLLGRGGGRGEEGGWQPTTTQGTDGQGQGSQSPPANKRGQNLLMHDPRV